MKGYEMNDDSFIIALKPTSTFNAGFEGMIGYTT